MTTPGGARNGSPEAPVVYVVDDDSSVRRALGRIMRAAGYACELFDSAEAFLDKKKYAKPSCLVVDLQLPGLDGLELQKALSASDVCTPPVFISGHGDIPASVQAMKGGAIDFLPKPFDDDRLLKAVAQAIAESERLRRQRLERKKIGYRAQRLTTREKQVFSEVVAGLLNKQIALRLKISEKTVKVHRARVMQKMRAGSVADLVRQSEKIPLQLG